MNSLLSHIVELSISDTSFSDVQVEQGQPVMWRKPEGWSESGYGIAEAEDIIPVMNAINREWKALLKQGGAIDRAIDLSHVRLRCNAYTTNAGARIAITIRKLPLEPLSLEQLRLPAQVAQFATMPKGLLLISGATGSGKTTTIAALVKRINETRAAHIVTIEEPIEYLFARRKSIITQREVGQPSCGADAVSFSSGLREALRQRPDVIVVGEIRDADTADTVLRAAESGHYVMATVHARNTVGAIQKMLSFFPNDAAARATTLANTLCGVISQTLLPSVDGKRFVPALELIINADPTTTAMIANVDKHRQLEEKLKTGQMPGCTSMNSVLKKLVVEGTVSRKAAMAASYAPEELDILNK